MDFKFNPFTENLCLTETTRVTALENTYVRSQWFKQIDSGTSGTLVATTEIGTSAEFIADQWPDDVDMLVSVVTSGERPDRFPPRDAAGNPISATFNTSTGAWALSGTPNAYPVALIYCYRQKLVNFTDTKALVDFAYELPTDSGLIVREESGGVIANHVSNIKFPDSTLTDNGDNSVSIVIPHSVTTGRANDEHSGYWWLNGRAGNYTAYGSTDAGGTFNLHTTSHATKGTGNVADTLYVDEVNNRVGVGVAAPTDALNVSGTIGTDKLYIGYDTSYSLFNLNATKGDITASAFYFINQYPTWQPTADIAKHIYGINLGLNINDTNATGNMTGDYYGAVMETIGRNNTNTINNIYGGKFSVRKLSGAASVTTAAAAIFGGIFDTGTTGTWYGNIINTPISYGGTLNNAFAIKILPQTLGTILNYAIYTENGLVRFGDTVIIMPPSAATTGQIIQGYAAQTAPMLEIQKSDGTVYTAFDEIGQVSGAVELQIAFTGGF